MTPHGMELHTGKLPDGAAESEATGTALIHFAIEKGVSVEVLERLVALQERVAQRNAEMAMAQALAAFQEECPPVPRTKIAEVKKDGRKVYEFPFAPYEEIARVIRPFLTKHGLSYTHDAAIGNGQVTVVCTLQHIEGATRKATFSAPVDNSGGKNPVQAVASSRQYGRRYSLIDVLGLVTEDEAEGGEPAVEPVAESQAADLESLADEVGVDKVKFLDWLGVESFAAIPKDWYKRAERALENKRRR